VASKKERVWLAEYLKTFNATEAARRAGYKNPEVLGSRKKAKFAEEISAVLAEKTLSADAALARLAEIATFDISPYVVQRGDAAYIDANKLKADGHGHLIRAAYTMRDGPRIDIADQSWALKVILDHHTRAASGRSDDPIHVRALDLDTLIERIYGSSDD
jgi:hypothetical protein